MQKETIKKCNTCKQEKFASDFNKNKDRKDGLSGHCRNCNKVFNRKYYESNKEKSHQRREEFRKNQRKVLRGFILNYLRENGCIDCGITDPVVLEFDHVRGEKLAGISDMVRAGRPMKILLNEIAKCEVRCANCHKRKTAKDFGWYKAGD